MLGKRKIIILVTLVLCCMLAIGTFSLASAASSTISISRPSAWSLWSYDDSVTARWNAVTGASGYYIAMRFTTDDDLVLERTYTTNTSYKISSYFLEKAGIYHIWVGAVASKGDTTYLSQDQHDFYVAHEPDITNGSASSITSTSVTLSMDINLNYGYAIDHWGFYVGTSSSVGSMDQYSQGSTSGKGTHSATISGLSPNTTYYYRAYAENEVGEEYSTYKSFTTKAASLSKPVISSPSSGGTYNSGSSIKLQWGSVSGASGYRYYIKQLAGEPDYSSESESAVNSWEGSTTSTSYTLSSSNVKGGYWYKFVVEAYAGSTSAWSEWCYVYVEKGQLAKAVVVSPVNTATYTGNASVKFDWNAVSGATGYHYYVKRLSGMPDRTNENEPAAASWDAETTATEFTLSAANAVPGYWYKFVVEAHAEGMNASWSEWVYCYVEEPALGKPQISSPSAWSEVTEGKSISVKWGSVTGAAGYKIHIKQLSDEPDSGNTNESCVNEWRIDRGTTTSYTLSSGNVVGGYWYKFVVEAYSSYGSSTWSPYVYVHVDEKGDLDRPIITSPLARQNYEFGKDIRFTWAKVENATAYRYYIKQLKGEPDYSDDEASTYSWSGSTGPTGRGFTLSGDKVQPNTWYKFVVKAEASGYNSSWSRYTYIKIPDREDWIHYILPSGMESVEEETFMGNKLLRTFDASNSRLQVIESKAFANCTNLKSINLPVTVTEIAEDAFSNCPNLKIHCISGSYAETYATSKGIAVEVHGIAMEADSIQISNKEWNIPTIDAAEMGIKVNSSANWTASASASWISLSRSSGTDGISIIVAASKNTSKTSRTGSVTFICGNAKAVLKIVQNASASKNCDLNVNPEYWEPSSSMLSREIVVQSSGNYSVSSNASWLTFTKSNGSVTAKVTSASLTSRKTGILTITCDDCGATKTVTVSIAGTVVPVPTGVKAETVDPQIIKVSWNLVDGASYVVERSVNGSSGWTQVGTVGVGTNTVNDTGLGAGTTYYYRVYARKNISGSTVSSSASTVVSGITSSVSRFSFTGRYGTIGFGGVDTLANLGTLSWTKNASATTYKVSLRNLSSGGLVIGSENTPKDVGNVNSLSVSSSLKEGTSYRVWVGGYNNYGHLITQTDALEFTVQSSTVAKPTISVTSVSPTTVGNSGLRAFAITFTATNAHTFVFQFNGLEVEEAWDKDEATVKQGYQDRWEFDGPTQVENYSYNKTIGTVKFYPKENTAARDYNFTITVIGYGGDRTSDSKAINIKDSSKLANTIVARAYEWLNYSWVLPIDVPVHNPNYWETGSSHYQEKNYYKKGTTMKGLPYTLNASKYFIPGNYKEKKNYISDLTVANKGEVIEKKEYTYYSNKLNKYVTEYKWTPKYGADCSALANDCFYAADTAAGHDGQTSFSTKTCYQKVDLTELKPGDAVYIPSHVRIVVEVSGNNITCIEQRGGAGATQCKNKTVRAGGGYYVCGNCTYCNGSSKSGTVKATYTIEALKNTGYKGARFIP